MANKRELKKEIKCVCGGIAAEAMLAENLVKGVDKAAMQDAVVKLAELQVKALKRCSFSFDKLPHDFASGREYHKARALYFGTAYKSLRKKFYDNINEIVKQMNAAVPQEVKDNNIKK